MIKSLPLRELRNAEYLQFMDFIIKIIEDNNPTVLKVAAQLGELKTRYAESDALFVLPKANSLSADVLEIDTKRDNALKGIFQVVSGYLKHFQPNYREAAKALDKNIKLYGTQIYNLNYQAESSVIASLTKDWESDTALAAALVLLNLKSWSDELVQNNADFIALYTARTQEYGAKSPDTLKIKRNEGIDAYLKLVKYLNAYNTVDDTGAYAKVINEINALVNQYGTLLDKRDAKPNDATGSEYPRVQ